jgi:hypothetical protein
MARPSADQYTFLTAAPIQSGSAMIFSRVRTFWAGDGGGVAGAETVAPAETNAWNIKASASRQGLMNGTLSFEADWVFRAHSAQY